MSSWCSGSRRARRRRLRPSHHPENAAQFGTAKARASVLVSMTGYGDARYQSEALNLAIELRALNNRYLKVSVRATEPYNLLEAEFEKVIRRTVRRGTLQVNVRCERQYSPQDFRVNAVALRSYLDQI